MNILTLRKYNKNLYSGSYWLHEIFPAIFTQFVNDLYHVWASQKGESILASKFKSRNLPVC